MTTPVPVQEISFSANDFVTSWSFDVDCTASNLIHVAFGWRRNNGQDVSGVTIGGVSATLKVNDTSGTFFGGGMALAELANPGTGTKSVVVTFVNNDVSGRCAVGTTFSNGNTTTPSGTATSASDSAGGSTVTVDLSSVSGELAMCYAFFRGGTDIATVTGAGQTDVAMDGGAGAGESEIAGECSSEPGAATNTMSYTYTPTGTHNAAIIAISLKESTGGGGPSQALLYHRENRIFLMD